VNLTGKVLNFKLRQEANTVYGYVRKIIWYMEIKFFWDVTSYDILDNLYLQI